MRACGETTLEAGEQQVREIQREGAWSVSSTGSVAPAVITLGRQEAQVSRQERSKGQHQLWGGVQVSSKDPGGVLPSGPVVRICLPMQGHGFRPWSGNQHPTCHGATKPMCHNY